jgi:7-keto-8-aminopelargonate synthetase-like enzyme
VDYGLNLSMSRAFIAPPGMRELEDKLDAITGMHTLVFATTTLASQSFMAIMVQKGDTLVLDERVHNSVQMAALFARGARIVWCRHNDLDQLEALAEEHERAGTGRLWYAADGIYSMRGTVAPVRSLLALADRYPALHLYLDDAHGMSTQGKHGRGYVLDQVEQPHPRLFLATSLIKGFGAGGGGLLALPTRWQRDLLQRISPSQIFSVAVSSPVLGAAHASADIHLSDELSPLLDDLHARIRHFRTRAGQHGLRLSSDARSPLQFVLIEAREPTFRVSEDLLRAGFYVNCSTFPATADDEAGVRLTLSRHITLDDIDRLVDVLATSVRAHRPEALA